MDIDKNYAIPTFQSALKVTLCINVVHNVYIRRYTAEEGITFSRKRHTQICGRTRLMICVIEQLRGVSIDHLFLLLIHTYIFHFKPRGFYDTIVVQEIVTQKRRFTTTTPQPRHPVREAARFQEGPIL